MNFVLAIFEDPNISIPDSLLISLIAILIVFLILIIIIFIAWLFQKGIEKINTKTHILPKEENKILDEDEDAAIAVVVASIEFNKETGKEPEVISITKEN